MTSLMRSLILIVRGYVALDVGALLSLATLTALTALGRVNAWV